MNTAVETLQKLKTMIVNQAAECVAFQENWGKDFAMKKLTEITRNERNAFHSRVTLPKISIDELQQIPKSKLFELGFGNWDDEIVLIPLWAFHIIKDGEPLIDIMGNEAVKSDEIDLDVRFGCIAFGFIPKGPSGHNWE